MPLVLYTQLKNTDLHALSAFEALVHVMKLDTLRTLKRYQRWKIETTTPVDLSFFISNSYVLANSNKESVSDVAPPLHSSSDTMAFRLFIKSPLVDAIDIMNKLNTQFDNCIHSLSHRFVWDLTVARQGRSEASIEAFVLDHMIVSRSSTQGLLVNPLLDQFELTRI